MAHAGVLHQQGSGGGDGQHAHAVLGGKHVGSDLLGGEPLDGHIHGGVQPVLGQQIVEDVLRVGPLAGGVDGLALQVGHGLDGVPLLQDVQHTHRVHCQHLNGAVGLVVEVGGHIGGHSGDVCLAVGQQGSGLAVFRHHDGTDGDGAVSRNVFRGVVLHQIGSPYTGRAGEDGQIDGEDLIVRGGDAGRGGAGADGGAGAARLGGCLCGTAARGREEEQGGQEQGQKLGSFHGRIPFSDLDGYTYSGQRRIVDWICTPKGKFSYPEPRTPSRAAGSGTRMARPSRRIRPACSKS